MEKIHKRLIVIGEVQGVGYRYSCLKVARSMGIKGYVKNLSDGNVYIEAEGTNKQLILFIKWCYEGPSHARVHEVNIENGELCEYKYFDLRH